MMPFCAVISEHHNRPQTQSDNAVTGKSPQMHSSGAQQLRHSAAAGDVTKVAELCRKSIPFDADIEGRTALHYASANGHVDVVKELIACGAKVNVKDALGYTPLLHAATDGHIEVVKLLLNNNANADAQDEVHYNSALHEASWKGYSQTIEALCRHKANPYLKNKQGHSALHLACQQGHNQSCRILLMTGCKPDINNNFGDSPLHSAARYGHAGVVRILLSAFCNVNEVNKNGDTALHISAAMGRRKLTRILLESGCNPTITNKQGETAMDIALRKSYTVVQDIIANPPPLKTQITSHTKKPKREKESSQGSKDSTEKTHNERFKKNKCGSNRSVHFTDEKKDKEYWSPYGCHIHPKTSEDFPKPNLDSLPSDPLSKGEQYYVDLAGNIRKGPIARVNKCFCKPLLHSVEKRMQRDKKELIDHIETAHDSLNEKICSLEKKTHNQLVTLNETVKQKLAHQTQECNERVQRSALKERMELERRQRLQVEELKGEVSTWLTSKLDNHRRSSEHMDQFHNNHNHNHRFHKHHINRSSSQMNVHSIVHHKSAERPQSSQGAHTRLARLPISVVSRSKSEMYLTANLENSDEEAINHENVINQSEVRTQEDMRTQSVNQDNHYVQSSSTYDCEKSGARPKEAIRSADDNEVNVKSDNSGSSLDINEQNRIENMNVDNDKSVLSKEEEHINDIALSADLMKSLRCNGNAYNSGDQGDSPFNDSGYRTKFSPSPRDPTISVLTVNNNQNRIPSQLSPPFRHSHPVSYAADPPIGLPPPDQHLIYGRRFQMPVNVHTHQSYNGPNSSLV